eukprot:4139622-Prymnesium_polylepis.2
MILQSPDSPTHVNGPVIAPNAFKPQCAALGNTNSLGRLLRARYSHRLLVPANFWTVPTFDVTLYP